MESGKHFLSRWLPFSIYDSSDTVVFDGEQKIVRLYSVFYIAGILLTFSLFVFYFLPQAYYAYSTVLSNLRWSTTSTAFWDAVAFLGQTVLLVSLLFYARRKA